MTEEQWSSSQPPREVGSDDLDALRDVVEGALRVQRDLVALLAPTDSALAERLSELEQKLEGVRRGSSKHLAGMSVEELVLTEPDGTVRLIATSSAKEARGRVGLLFFSDEGRECGGISYGTANEEGTPSAWSVFTMDQFRQDQILGLRYSEHASKRSAGFFVWERPELDMEEILQRQAEIEAMEPGPERDVSWERFLKEAKMGPYWPTRVFAGRNEADDAAIELHDLQGRVRLRLVVTAQGEARVEFLNSEGDVTRAVAPTG